MVEQVQETTKSNWMDKLAAAAFPAATIGFNVGRTAVKASEKFGEFIGTRYHKEVLAVDNALTNTGNAVAAASKSLGIGALVMPAATEIAAGAVAASVAGIAAGAATGAAAGAMLRKLQDK